MCDQHALRFACLAFMVGGLSHFARAQPIATITSPAAGACACAGDLLTVRGSSRHTTPASYRGDALEYSTNPGVGPWVVIGSNSGTTPVNNADLYFWNTNGLPAGTYYLRLTVRGTDAIATAISSVSLGAASPAPEIRGFADGDAFSDLVTVRSGKVGSCDGPIAPTIEYRDPGTGVWSPIPTIDVGLYVEGSINLSALPSGPIDVRAQALGRCGPSAVASSSFVVDRSDVHTTLAVPSSCSFVRGVVTVAGTVQGPTLASWTLEYAPARRNAWTTIASSQLPITNGLLGSWDTQALAPCAYVLRLRATSSTRTFPGGPQRAFEEYLVVNVGCASDFNRSGDISVQDVFDFLTAWFAPCF